MDAFWGSTGLGIKQWLERITAARMLFRIKDRVVLPNS
jgi:hypothetical protein